MQLFPRSVGPPKAEVPSHSLDYVKVALNIYLRLIGDPHWQTGFVVSCFRELPTKRFVTDAAPTSSVQASQTSRPRRGQSNDAAWRQVTNADLPPKRSNDALHHELPSATTRGPMTHSVATSATPRRSNDAPWSRYRIRTRRDANQCWLPKGMLTLRSLNSLSPGCNQPALQQFTGPPAQWPKSLNRRWRKTGKAGGSQF